MGINYNKQAFVKAVVEKLIITINVYQLDVKQGQRGSLFTSSTYISNNWHHFKNLLAWEKIMVGKIN